MEEGSDDDRYESRKSVRLSGRSELGSSVGCCAGCPRRRGPGVGGDGGGARLLGVAGVVAARAPSRRGGAGDGGSGAGHGAAAADDASGAAGAGVVQAAVASRGAGAARAAVGILGAQ